MSGFGYGYGFGTKPPAGGDVPGPPSAGMYSWVDGQDVTTREYSANDYVDLFHSAGGSYAGDWDSDGVNQEACQYYGDDLLNGLIIPKIWKPTGGVPAYSVASEQGPWANASFAAMWYHEDAILGSPIYLTGSNTYWQNGFVISNLRKMGMRIASTFYYPTIQDVWDVTAWNIGIWRYRKTGTPSIQCYLNGVDVTTTDHDNIGADMYVRRIYATEAGGGDITRAGDCCIYNTFIDLDTVNELGSFLSNKYALGQTWELS